MRRHGFRVIGAAVGILLWASLPYGVGDLLSLSVFVLIALYIPIVVGLSVLSGYTGQVSLGQAAFYGLGAYLTAILSTHLDWKPWLSIPTAVALTGLIAYGIGRPILVLRGHYLVVATLGLNIIVEVLIRELHGLTGGPSGLSGIPPLAAGSMVLRGDRAYYYAASLLAAGAVAASALLIRSRVGRALQAIATSETAAETLGIDAASYKARVFAWSAVLAAASGCLYAHYVGYLSPSPFSFNFSVELLVMAVIGGLASLPGAVVGSAITVLLREQLRTIISGLAGGAGAEYEVVIYGLILAAVVIFAPDGLWPSLARWWSRRVTQPGPRPAQPIAGESPSSIPALLPVPPMAGSMAAAGGIMPPAAIPTASGDHGPMLEVQGLGRRFGGLTALQDLSFSVRPGEIYAIIGPNGAGKTTLFNLVSGVLAPSSGTVRVDGQEIRGWPAHQVAALGIARTFQTPRLVPHLSVLENVLIGMHRHLRTGFAGALLGLGRREHRRVTQEVQQILALTGLSGLASAPAGSLPFGLQRLVEVARCMAGRPRLLLMDEPASGLSGEEREELVDIIRRIRAQGTTVVLVEHDVSLVMKVADRMLVLHHGQVLAEGTPEVVREDPAVIEAYLGRAPEDAPDLRPEATAGSAIPSAPRLRRPVPGELLLVVEDLRAGYGNLEVVCGASFRVRAGEVVAIVGSNGAGKSTLLKGVMGLIPAQGRVELAGQAVSARSPEDRTAMGLSLVPERRQLLWTMTVADHLALSTFARRSRKGHTGSAPLDWVWDLFPILRERQHQVAMTLSGGQQQMLAIARALMAEPRVLLLDEPLLGLAPQAVDRILKAVVQLRDRGLAIVLVEQNAAAILPVAQRVYVCRAGRLVEVEPGACGDLVRLETAFLGDRSGGRGGTG
ncbi:ABC transporter related protein [Thermaerobacter marianensis DSM 12885]|uniref:ABC transporter related protein n=1 Tax=Thermaerobacter marianensis (strain ATCC 700841 / DSM 12885 / JCM 10246 / 7p75a) TaxID=644966 RepID=E6SIA5_THEM7|nr:ATP-binding cassette domain-containing protein [Thermaerobacter marianensis]ADU51916.1 ABC transporter related protein [Thermaerobacter marianensis DSM 12885]